MNPSQLRTTVLQYAVIRTLHEIIPYEISRYGLTDLMEDPVVQNLTNVLFHGSPNGTMNTTELHSNSPLLGTRFENPDSFYFSNLPREVFICVLLCPLTYYWQILLERAFPSRPRRKEVVYEKEKVEIKATVYQEEQIVKRLIDEGKVQRSSILFWNTIFKWVLDITIGQIWYMSLDHWLSYYIHWDRNLDTFKTAIFLRFIATLFSLRPFISLLSFIVVPVSKRVVIVAGLQAIETIIYSLFMTIVAPMVLLGEWTQDLMRNFTESAMKERSAGVSSGRLTIDEL